MPFDAIEHVEQAGEVDPAEHQAERRHDDAFDERRDDLAERRADDDADGQVDDVAAGDELLEFFEHGASPAELVSPRKLDGGERITLIGGRYFNT